MIQNLYSKSKACRMPATLVRQNALTRGTVMAGLRGARTTDGAGVHRTRSHRNDTKMIYIDGPVHGASTGSPPPGPLQMRVIAPPGCVPAVPSGVLGYDCRLASPPDTVDPTCPSHPPARPATPAQLRTP